MKRFLVPMAAAFAIQSCAQVKAPAPIYPIPTPAQVAWQKMEQYAFVHFGLNTFNDLEWGFGDTPAATFNPTHLDVEQWIRTVKAAGLKGIIITAKHHDGFCLWQSKYTDYSVKNSPWKDGKGDMVREMIEACKKHGLKVGLYLSPWDRNHAQYGKEEYVTYFRNQIDELINQYCNDGTELFEYWFDGANGGDGYYGGARERRNINPGEYYQYEKCGDIIHERFPDAMIFGGTSPTIRWIGNESGWAGETNWAMWTNGLGESKQLQWGMEEGRDWLPGEVDVSIRPGWFYHEREDHQLKSLSKLIDIYYQSVGRNANLLLNFTVSLRGTIPAADSARIIEWRKTIDEQLKTNLLKDAKVEASNSRGGNFKATKVNDDNWDSYWATQEGVVKGELNFTFKKPTELNRILLQEYIPLGQRVKAFSVDYFANGEWRAVPTTDTMSTIGYKRIIRFKNVTAERIRVNFLDARGALAINNIEAFCAPALLVEPTITRDANGKVSIKGADETANLYYTTDGSEPTINSTPYTAEFALNGKGTVKALAQDPAARERVSSTAVKNFDILASAFSVKGAEGSAKMFDGNTMTSYELPKGKSEATIDLGGEYDLVGFSYLPNQSRWGGGVITHYEIWANGKRVAQGEFSNIKANPIEQTIMFDAPVSSSQLKFVAKALAQGSGERASIAEFGVITK